MNKPIKPFITTEIIPPASGLTNVNAPVIVEPILTKSPPVIALPKSKTVNAMADMNIKQQLVKQFTKQLLKNPIFFHLQNFFILINSQRLLNKLCYKKCVRTYSLEVKKYDRKSSHIDGICRFNLSNILDNSQYYIFIFLFKCTNLS